MKRFRTSNLKQLDSQIEKNVKLYFEVFEDLAQKSCLDNTHPSNESRGNDIRINITRTKHKMVLAVILWYLPEELGWKIRLWLDQHWGASFKEFWATAQISKELALAALVTQNRISDREFFGTLLRETVKIFCVTFRDKFRKPKPKRPVRRKGYRDKGSLRDPSKTPIYTGKLLTEKELFQRRLISILQNRIFLEQCRETLQKWEN